MMAQKLLLFQMLLLPIVELWLNQLEIFITILIQHLLQLVILLQQYVIRIPMQLHYLFLTELVQIQQVLP